MVKYANSFPNPTLPLSDQVAPRNKLRHVSAKVEIRTADAPGEIYYIARIPGIAILSAASTRRHAAVTGLNDVDFGDANDPDGLIDGASWATAANAPAPLFPAKIAQGIFSEPVYKALGYTENPGDVELYFTAKADPGADEDVEIDLIFSLPE